jgi:hypothetical protein
MEEVQGGRHFQISKVIFTDMEASRTGEHHERTVDPQPTTAEVSHLIELWRRSPHRLS